MKIDFRGGVETPDGTSAVKQKQGGVFETPWAVPVPAEERILPTAFPLPSEKEIMYRRCSVRRPAPQAEEYHALSEAHR